MKKLVLLLLFIAIQFTTNAQTKTRACDSTFADTDGVTVHTCADKKPGFGKENDKQYYTDFIESYLIYPKAARDAGTSGRVMLQVIITENGELKDAKVVNGIKGKGANECNAEALRVVKLLPKWKPATIDGKPVRFVMRLPVYFKDETVVKEVMVDLSDAAYDDVVAPPPPPPVMPYDDAVEPKASVYSDTMVYSGPEVMPEFPGGITALEKYIDMTKKGLPADCGTNGSVFVSFIVEKDGSLSNFINLREVNTTCGNDVIASLKKMPNWKPGMQNGKQVRAKYIIPVKFNTK